MKVLKTMKRILGKAMKVLRTVKRIPIYQAVGSIQTVVIDAIITNNKLKRERNVSLSSSKVDNGHRFDFYEK